VNGMCTMGMMKRMGQAGEATMVVAKTVDTQPTNVAYERLERSSDAPSILCFRMGWQPGVNAGMNEHGLVVMSSYLGWHKPSRMQRAPDFAGDTRGLANLRALQMHTTADSAAQTLVSFFADHPSAVGGVHFLMDAAGGVAVVEHAEGQIGWEIAVASGSGPLRAIVRANDAELIDSALPDGMKIDAYDAEDRAVRRERMLGGLRSLPLEDGLGRLKRWLGSHANPEGGQHGQICIHDYGNDGQRSISHAAHHTETALIFDIPSRTMLYSEGAPCRQVWKSVTL